MSNEVRGAQKAMSSHDLEALRCEIDQIDQQLVALFERRAEVVFSVGEYKRANNLPVYDPAREARIKDKVSQMVAPTGPLAGTEMASLFSKMVESFRLLESAHTQKELARHLMTESHLDFNQPHSVVFWGFGLLGASVCLALNEMLPHWNFLIRDPYVEVDAFQSWKKRNKISNIELINEAQMTQAQIYILAAPVEMNVRHLSEFDFPKGSLVFDLGSTKKTIVTVWQQRRRSERADFYFVGGHPLAGKEVSGFDNGDSTLFYNKTFCWIQPDLQHLDISVQKTCEVISLALGAFPSWMSADDHDAALAWTSHLPQVLGSVLSLCLAQKDFSKRLELFPGVVSELLRVGGSPYSMWKSIISSNQQNLQSSVSELASYLKSAAQDMADPASCEKLFQNSNKFYEEFKSYKMKKGA